MHDLIAFDPALTGTLSHALIPAEEQDTLRTFAENEKAASTRKCYQKDYATFEAWCGEKGLVPLPAAPATVARFIAFCASEGKSVSTIGRRLAGISYAHKLAKQGNPSRDDEVRMILSGIRRTCGVAPKRKAAATADRVRLMLDACPDSMIGLRDKALLALGFAGAFRRSELIALRVEDLTEVPDGYRVTIRRSKTDQEGKGVTIAIPRGQQIQPVLHVQNWMQAAGITGGLLFRPVRLGGAVAPGAIRAHDVARIVKQYAAKVGLDATEISAHSLRAGFITSAAEAGASVYRIQAVSRHKSMDVLSAYVRAVDDFRDHAGAGFL
jgi:site-specific recombinase XerD